MALVTLAEVRDYLNITTGDVAINDELQRFIDGVQPVVENIVGPVDAQTFDEFHDGGRGIIVLTHYPVISIQTITEYNGTVGTVLTVAATPDVATATSYVLDPDGILYRSGTGIPICFAYGYRNIRVQYTAGRASVPPNIKLGALEFVRHLYQSTQQGGRPNFSGADDDLTWAPAAFAVPTRVIELLEPHRREPRLA